MAFFKWFLAVVICASITKMPGTVSERFHRPPATLSIEKERVCANRGDSLSLSCTLNLRGTKKASREWTLSWHSDGITFKKNATEKWQNSTHLSSSLRINAVWSGEELFTCAATRLSKKDFDTSLHTSTVVNVKSPTQCSIIGSRFIEQPIVNLFEVYWRPVNTSLENVVYSLNICTEPEDLPLNGVCPHYHTVKGWCFHSEKNIYNLKNTKGFICKANVSSGLTVYRTFISSKLKDEDCEHRCSTQKRFYLNIFRDLIPEPDAIEIVLIPSPVVNLRVIPRPSREVSLIWSRMDKFQVALS